MLYKRILSLILITLSILVLPLQIIAQDVVPDDYILQGEILKVLNHNIQLKTDVITYWMQRASLSYTPDASIYTVNNISQDELFLTSTRILLLIKQSPVSNATLEEKIAFIDSFPKDWIIYTTDFNSNHYNFSFKTRELEIFRESYPSMTFELSLSDERSLISQFQTISDEQRDRLYSKLTASGDIPPLKSPIKNVVFDKVISSYFGDREDIYFDGNNLNYHTGLDFAMPFGTDIRSVASGVVETVFNDTWGYGNHLIINHNSYYTMYAHCSDILVKQGQTVKAGQVIAKVGSTGWSTGNHLHFELIKDGTPIDPLPYLNE